MWGELARAALVAAAFLLIFGAAEAWRHFGRPSVEFSRKFVHFVGGLLVLAFPWIFNSRWTVLGLVGVFALLLSSTKRLGLLESVHGVARKSAGGLLYPLSVALLFTLAHDEPALYLIAASTLIVSDTMAALLGTAYGTVIYSVEEDRRSLEGSISFLVTTFLVVHIPMLLMTGIDREATVLLAAHIALIVTLLEGVSLQGSDNLLVPMATYYLLVRFGSEGAGAIATHLLVLLAIVALVSLFGLASHLLRVSGVMATGVFFYAVYLLGGGGWMVAPAVALTVLFAFRYALRNGNVQYDAHFQVLATLYAVVVGLAILLTKDVLPRILDGPAWLVSGEAFPAPFVGIVVGQLSLVLATQFNPFRPGSRRPGSPSLTFGLFALSLGVVAPIGLLSVGALAIESFAVTAAIGALTTGFYWLARTLPGWPAEAPWNMRLQTMCVIAATLLVLPFYFTFLGVE